MTEKLPWMPFYGSIFYEDEAVCLMSLEEEAIYLRLLWRQWREGSLPAEAVDLEKLLPGSARGLPGVSPRVLACLPRCDDGRRRNPKLEQIRAAQLAMYEKKSLGGKVGRAKQLEKPTPKRSPGNRRAEPGHTPGTPQAEPGHIERERDKTTATWLTPFADAWQARCGNPPFGRLAKILAPLVQQLGEPEVVARWSRYLESTEPRYCSPERFVATHAAYAGPSTLELTDEMGAMRLHTQRDGWWGYEDRGRWVQTIEVAKVSA